MDVSGELRNISLAWILELSLDINLSTSNRMSGILRFNEFSFSGDGSGRRIGGFRPVFKDTKVLALQRDSWPFSFTTERQSSL